MVQILKIIILTCQVSTGSVVPAVVDKHQKRCQKALVECVKPNTKGSKERLLECISER